MISANVQNLPIIHLSSYLFTSSSLLVNIQPLNTLFLQAPIHTSIPGPSAGCLSTLHLRSYLFNSSTVSVSCDYRGTWKKDKDYKTKLNNSSEKRKTFV